MSASAEDDFRAALVAHAPLVALVGDRVEQNGVELGTALPYVVYTTTHTPTLTLLGEVAIDEVAFQCECWSTTAMGADIVADAVIAALVAHAPLINAATMLSRGTGFDGDLGLDATVLTISWYA